MKRSIRFLKTGLDYDERGILRHLLAERLRKDGKNAFSTRMLRQQLESLEKFKPQEEAYPPVPHRGEAGAARGRPEGPPIGTREDMSVRFHRRRNLRHPCSSSMRSLQRGVQPLTWATPNRYAHPEPTTFLRVQATTLKPSLIDF